MTFEEACGLHYGQTVYHVRNRNADGTPQRWRVSGKVRLWKRTPGRIRVPVKHGLYDNDAITESALSLVEVDEGKASKKSI